MNVDLVDKSEPRGLSIKSVEALCQRPQSDKTGYVLSGEADLIVEGKTQHLKAGDSYAIPAGAVHDVKVTSSTPFKVLGIYVVDKTKPLATPAS
jgi:quercetin dioxygenase-like cupin family protein